MIEHKYKIILFFLFCAFSGQIQAQTGQTTAVVLDSFTTGQVSPKLEARQGFPKYNSACRTLENFLISPLGPVQRRPGTKYIATAKSGTPRLIKFEYSTDDVYCIEMGNLYMRFYRNGGQILDPNNNTYEIVTPFDANEIWDVRYAQNGNEMYLVDPNDEPQILTRTGHAAWTITPVDFELGPFSDENEDESLTITPSGTGEYSGNDYYRTTDNGSKIFYGTVWLAQTFTASDTYTTNGVQIKLRRSGNPGTITVSLRATAAGLPTGADLVSGTLDGDGLTTETAGEWKEVLFSSTQSLTSGTVYAIVIRATSASFPTSQAYWRIDSISPSYAGGSYIYSNDSGSSWTAYTAGDFMFGVLNNSVPASSISLTASGAVFNADHVGALWRLTHTVNANTIKGTFTWNAGMTDQNSSSLEVARNQDFTITTAGYWIGTLYVEKSYDDGVTWNIVYSHTSTGLQNLNYIGTESVEDCLYRLRMTNHMYYHPHADETYYSFDYTMVGIGYERQGIVEITAFVDVNKVNATVLYNLGGTSATWRWAEGAWSDYRGWPETIAFHQQRAIFGGNESYPTTIWCSAIVDYNDLSVGTLDDDGFAVAIQGQNPIRWLLSGDYLLVGTSGGVGKFGLQGKALTPSTPGYFEQSQHGSAPIQAVMAGDTVIYVERNLRKIREFGYTLQYDRYTTPDLTLLCEEITDPCIVEIAFQNRPWPILWCVLGNGNLATLCYHRDQMVAGWSQQTTDGNFASAVAMPGSGTTPAGDTWREDAVWTTAQRDVNSATVSMIELFTPVSWGTDPNYCWFVDSALSGTAVGGEPNQWSGLSHLATETVSVYANLDARDDEVVDVNGVIDCNIAYTKIIAGLPFTSKMETLSLKMPSEIADLRIADRKITMLDFDLYQSQYMRYGMGANATLMTYDPGSLKTDTINFSRLNFPFGSLKKPSIYIETAKPLPLCIRGIVPEITYYRPR